MTIQRPGPILFPYTMLFRSGIINANQSAGMTLQLSGGVTNTGTMEATGGALALTSTTVNNAGGTVSANNNMLQLRSEEHTSELQSHSELVCRLLREENNQGG